MRKIIPKTNKEMDVPVSSNEERKYYPQFRIELVHLPEAKKWDIGTEYTMTLKVKMTGISISRFQNNAEFDIIGIDPHTKSGSKEKE